MTVENHVWNTEDDAIDVIVVTSKLHKVRKILEIGTFKGYTAKKLHDWGFEVTTTDIIDHRDQVVKDSNITFVLGGIYCVDDRNFDAAFIDGEHSYYACSRDFKICEAMNIGLIFIHDAIGIPDVAKFVGEQKTNPHYDVVILNTSDGDGIAILKRL